MKQLPLPTESRSASDALLPPLSSAYEVQLTPETLNGLRQLLAENGTGSLTAIDLILTAVVGVVSWFLGHRKGGGTTRHR